MKATRYDVVVVAGGLAGLTAAILAARGGTRVVVLERSIEGRDRVIRLFAKVRARYRDVSRHVRMLNGFPAVVVNVRVPPIRERMARRYVLRCDIGLDDRIVCVHVVSPRRKMSAIA